ncbi:diguanylate phosphodiesterase [Alkalihalobacillus alcalophilus ATCC 27647 = CGMCC 1.3604]|uniref:Diguanylate phosphodiesterase n=1 Tax=Alkalihalobacillus alcalophilus ATCC 27647 = CGMCC 1.3604 TaxID=1218173 RepID=A0A094WMU2_ALKAL|nr:EAL domain-containing protein [Alkalihalobacillus alcalophilus]KGA97258.1 diguanylate phosphodiesterase [Alkalihalobacillus alcalophilus ATCC 27647 = CGMCC 1.3604]MED1562822.1 EAL-associated domain-containing protein [Alkalihalobacillus alcalophilus]THG90469.1 diguanylate phosphodiesterase [Alkalihalobacillus alcalophilus ATCC 27647 = CGMCC 1.3604]
MDPLDVMMNKDKIIPYYQPIISADKQLVIGYEVLAHILTEEGNKSLGWFFRDRTIPDEYRLELEDYVQETAIEHFQQVGQKVYLFFNYDANLLLQDNGETLIKRIESVQGDEDLKKHIVLQLDEQLISNQADEFKHLLAYIQSTGIQIAVNNIGFKSSNLDNLALLKPNIVKVNVAFLEEDSLPHLYREVHHSISMLSRKIGATLLFEGITGFNQLNYAWRNGGRYYQGDYLIQATRQFISLDYCKEKIQKEFQHFITFERRKVEAQIQLLNLISQKMKHSVKEIQDMEHLDQFILKVAADCHDFVFRVYICNQDGFQQTANAEKNELGKWELHLEGRNKNWSWRPYFLENIVRMNIEKKGLLSDLYTDIDRDERIRTYSYPISDSLYLFLDIPYDYLFEQDGLL